MNDYEIQGFSVQEISVDFPPWGFRTFAVKLPQDLLEK